VTFHLWWGLVFCSLFVAGLAVLIYGQILRWSVKRQIRKIQQMQTRADADWARFNPQEVRRMAWGRAWESSEADAMKIELGRLYETCSKTSRYYLQLSDPLILKPETKTIGYCLECNGKLLEQIAAIALAIQAGGKMSPKSFEELSSLWNALERQLKAEGF
jgi:hypothetical protein